jgi:hypothetical protein
MELFSTSFLHILGTAFGVCVVLCLLTCAPPFIARTRNSSVWHLALAVAAFAMLGFVTGNAMANSREPAVAAVMPAVLTLMGGVGAFLIGAKGVKTQAVVAALILNFSLSLMAGAFYGAELRVQNDLSVRNDIEVEKNRHAVDLQRLLGYVDLVKTKRDLEAQEKVDLSRFESLLERRPEESKAEDKPKKSEVPK